MSYKICLEHKAVISSFQEPQNPHETVAFSEPLQSHLAARSVFLHNPYLAKLVFSRNFVGLLAQTWGWSDLCQQSSKSANSRGANFSASMPRHAAGMFGLAHV